MNQPHVDPRRLRGNLLLLLAAALWGFAFVAQKHGAEHMGPFSFSSVRFAMGGLLLVGVIVVLDRVRHRPAAKRRAATRAVLVPGGICGLFLAAAVVAQQAALSYTSVGNAAFITGLYMVLVPVLGAFRGTRISLFTVLGVVLCVPGLYLIAVTEGFTIGRGDALLLAAALLFAIQILIVDHYAPRLSALRFSSAQFLSCAVCAGVAGLFLDAHPYGGMRESVIPLLYGGFISVGIAYTLQVFGQRDALAAHAALIMSMETVFGALGGALLLHENMGLRGYSGAALMILGIVASQLDSLRKPAPADPADPADPAASAAPAAPTGP
ncbi:MAG: DMT family transporter [Bifidobacteriaceae bacterium]|nr:DMT family transporter [Bifidobacteriaceae bacterium]